jgi:sulfur carrier protein
MIRLRVNGKAVELAQPIAFLSYLESLGANPQAIAVEINGEIIQRSDYPGRTVNDGDVIEIVRMVGGG